MVIQCGSDEIIDAFSVLKFFLNKLSLVSVLGMEVRKHEKENKHKYDIMYQPQIMSCITRHRLYFIQNCYNMRMLVPTFEMENC